MKPAPPSVQMLRCLLAERGMMQRIAKRCSVARLSLDKWMRGIAVPTEQAKVRLWRCFHIPQDQWEHAPVEVSPEDQDICLRAQELEASRKK